MNAANSLATHLNAIDGFSRNGRVVPNGPELERLAREAEVSVGHLYQVALGLRNPSWKLARALYLTTDGKVHFAEILGLGSATAASP